MIKQGINVFRNNYFHSFSNGKLKWTLSDMDKIIIGKGQIP